MKWPVRKAATVTLIALGGEIVVPAQHDQPRDLPHQHFETPYPNTNGYRLIQVDSGASGGYQTGTIGLLRSLLGVNIITSDDVTHRQ
jgi:hypothetical protein